MRQGHLLSLGIGLLVVSAAVAIVGVAAGGVQPTAVAEPPLGMMSVWTAPSGNATVSMDQAEQSVQSFLAQTGNKDLVIDELMEFNRNFYALIKEKSTGTGALELLVDRQTAAVSPEPGPNMMWNVKYGMMGGSVIGFGSGAGQMSVSPQRATQLAQAWLDQQGTGYVAGTPDAFYGYYTFHFLKGGKIAGMLSVNGQTGQVWFHTWHGPFIQSREVAG